MSTSVVGPGRQPAATHAHSPHLEAVDRSRIPTGLSWAPRDPTIARDEPNAGGLAATGAP
ncbi:hypothetical protein K523DRAFT_422369 [Schizophyllum commune Tattone D]|nr:hypothetical protein K523DRAFT_422369 [Schizophyllum commune Tattone D]